MRRALTILASGAIGVIIAPIIAPALGRALAPAARTSVKAGIRAWQRGRGHAMTLAETFEDLQAEVMHESESE